MHAALLQASSAGLVQTADKGRLALTSTLCLGQIRKTAAQFQFMELREEPSFLGMPIPDAWHL